MKTTPSFLVSMKLPVLQGTPAKEILIPLPGSSLLAWFARIPVGHFAELKEPIDILHLGTGHYWYPGGWNV